MSREIKFRAWDKHDNKMVQMDDVDSTTSTFPSLLAVGFHGLPIIIDDSSLKDNEIVGWNVDHKYVLMQYTGLTDKNGVEIYEGDVVQIPQWRNQKYKVIYEYGMFKVDGNSRFSLATTQGELSCEVIGNIYENPNLLEGDSK